MYKIAIFNQKGGVGKTSITLNLAATLFKTLEKSVLIVDCDAQSNSSENLLAYGYDDAVPTFVDYINGQSTIEECISPIYINKGRNGKESLIESNLAVIPVGENIDDAEIEDIAALKDMISKVPNEYDYCLFDCSPQKTTGVYLALCAADYVLVPIDAGDIDSIKGWSMVLDLIDQMKEQGINSTLRIVGVVLNKFTKTRSIHTYLTGEFKESMGDALFRTTIRSSADIEQAKFFRQPICYYKPSSAVARDYDSLAIELDERIVQLNKKIGG